MEDTWSHAGRRGNLGVQMSWVPASLTSLPGHAAGPGELTSASFTIASERLIANEITGQFGTGQQLRNQTACFPVENHSHHTVLLPHQEHAHLLGYGLAPVREDQPDHSIADKCVLKATTAGEPTRSHPRQNGCLDYGRGNERGERGRPRRTSAHVTSQLTPPGTWRNSPSVWRAGSYRSWPRRRGRACP
jgi:hypothetical protein